MILTADDDVSFGEGDLQSFLGFRILFNSYTICSECRRSLVSASQKAVRGRVMCGEGIQVE